MRVQYALAGAGVSSLSGCAADTSETIALGFIVFAGFIALQILAFPYVKAVLERRDYERRMSRSWRDAQAQGRRDTVVLPKRKKRRSRREP